MKYTVKITVTTNNWKVNTATYEYDRKATAELVADRYAEILHKMQTAGRIKHFTVEW